MKKVIIVTFVVLLCCRMDAQTLTGVVYDKATQQPIPNVHVYLDGTSIFDITGDAGEFELTVNKILNTKLVLQHVSYQTVIIGNPFEEHLPDKFYMEERLNTLNEVTIQADRFTREQKLKAFREQFLGMTQAGKSCKIMNENDIQIWFNVQTKTLLASSDQPVVVINEYLGYQILFTLVDFWVQYPIVTLDRNYIQQSYYAVTTSYTDINPDNRRIKRRRDGIYEESSTFFFKNLTNNTLKEAGFSFYKNGLPADYNLYFSTEDFLSYKKLQLINTLPTEVNIMKSLNGEPMVINYIDNNFVDENGNIVTDPTLLNICNQMLDNTIQKNRQFSVLYRRKQSDIHFYTDTLLVDQYGNIDQIDKVMFSGLMGQNRAGDMLPLDYEP
jgi:hypothetical protein